MAEWGTRKALKRRGILAAAGAVVAGIAAKQVSQPVTANDQVWSLPYSGTASAPDTFAFYVNNSSANSSSQGIQGSGSSIGVGGNGRIGVYGVSGGGDSGLLTGLVGVGGECLQSNGTGVYGYATNGSVAKAVYGKTIGGYGVYGDATGSGGYGVTGNATTAYGVIGRSSSGVGVQGESSSNNGVVGITSGTGVLAGVNGHSSSAYGIIGSTTASGYSGLTAITGTTGVAALAATSTNIGAYAAYFTGTTVVQGNFYVVSGVKAAAVKDASGQHRVVYCVESPESWFEDFGEGKLVAGKAEVKLDPAFTQIAHTDHYHVFLTGYDEQAGALVVSERRADGFVVKERNKGTSNQAFSYRVVAKRSDIKGERLAKFAMPKINIPDESKLQRPEPPKAGPSPLPPTKP